MKLMPTCIIRVNSFVVCLMIFALLFSGAERKAGGAPSTDSSDAPLDVPIELGFFQTLTGIGGTVSSVPPGIIITYELSEGEICAEGPIPGLAQIFDQIVVLPSNHTQVLDLFPNDDPVDFALIVQALTDGQPNLFCLWTRFALPVSGLGGRGGPDVEISVPPNAQILFFRLTVAPFSIIQPPPDPRYFETTPFQVRVAAFGLLSPLEIAIDIKPGEFPNPINPKSKGLIPVAILTTDTFEATAVDPLSVEFGPNGATEAHRRGHIEDVDGDGDVDLVLHFDTQATGIECEDTSASLHGVTLDGQEIEGSDTIQTVGCK